MRSFQQRIEEIERKKIYEVVIEVYNGKSKKCQFSIYFFLAV